MIELVFDRDDFDRRRDGLVARVLEGDTNKIKFDSNGMLATLYNEVKRRDHVVIDVPGRPYGNMVAGGLAGFLIGCWVDMYLPIFPVAGAVVGVLAGYFKPISTEEPVDLDVFYRHAKQELHQDEEVFQEKMADGCTYERRCSVSNENNNIDVFEKYELVEEFATLRLNIVNGVPTEIGVFERENLRKGVVYVGRVPDNYVPPAIPHNSIATYPLFDKILGYKIMVSLPFSDTMIEIFNDCQNYVRLANS